MSEFVAGLSIFKALYDSAKDLKDINDATIRNSAVIELQEKILTAREAQTALTERINELERVVASFEAWDVEKQRYKMKTTAQGGIVYSLNVNAELSEPPHDICPNCYQNRRKSILQKKEVNAATMGLGKPPLLKCIACNAEVLA